MAPAKRSAALELQVRRWSPFAETAKFVVWNAGCAQVWVWDAAAVGAVQVREGYAGSLVFPEPVLRAPPEVDGPRLSEGLDGYEGQLWREGVLAGSRWWRQFPSIVEWNAFLRAHGIPAVTTLPSVDGSSLLERPWGGGAMGVGAGFLRSERAWVAAGIALWAAFAVWDGVAVFRYGAALDALRADREALEAQTRPVLSARGHALDDRARSESLAALSAFPGQYELLIAVSERLPSNGARLVEWAYDRPRLHVVVQAPNPDLRYYVQTYQTAGPFFDVTANLGNTPGQVVLDMQVRAAGAGSVGHTPDEAKG